MYSEGLPVTGRQRVAVVTEMEIRFYTGQFEIFGAARKWHRLSPQAVDSSSLENFKHDKRIKKLVL